MRNGCQMEICPYVRMYIRGGQGSFSAPHTPLKGVLIKAYIASISFLSKAFLIPPKMLYDKLLPPMGFYHIYICTLLYMYICTYASICTYIHYYICTYGDIYITTFLHM